jgi:hypothetical protein
LELPGSPELPRVPKLKTEPLAWVTSVDQPERNGSRIEKWKELLRPFPSASSVPLRFKDVGLLFSVPPCLRGRFLCDRFQHVGWRGVIAKSLTHVDEKVFVAWRKHKAAAKLQRVFAQAMLLMSRSLCPLACLQVVFAQQMEQGSVTQPNRLIGFAFVVDQQREVDARFLAEELGIAGVAQANNSKMRAFLLKLGFKFAQLRDVLSAEDSTVVPKEDHDGRPTFPERAETCRLAIGVWERYSGQLAAE